MAESSGRIELPEDDEGVPLYTPEDERRLAENLLRLHTAVEDGQYRSVALTPDYVCRIHAALFHGVDGHAGRHRCVGRGSEYRVFGPNRSVHRDSVKAEMDACLAKARIWIGAVERYPDALDRDRNAITVAVWTHAELVRIHPFEDGNGRTSRVVLDSILVRLELHPVPIEAAKQEYCDHLNEYFRAHGQPAAINPLVDLYIRLMEQQIDEF